MVGAIALVRDGELTDTAVEITQVHFRAASAASLDWYVATGEWRAAPAATRSRAPAPPSSRAIEGDYLNVVGLPLGRLLDLLPTLLADASTPIGGFAQSTRNTPRPLREVPTPAAKVRLQPISA